MSLTDIYGALLTQQLLSGLAQDPYAITLASQAARVESGDVPYPIYAAILAERKYEWMEFTPHVVGSDYLKAYVPTWAFGRQFDRGVSVDAAPPQSLGFLMGIWSWVLGIDMREILERYSSILPPVLANIVVSVSKEVPIAQRRIAPVPVLNYTKGMQGPYGLKEKLYLADAGLAFNIPLPIVVKKERAIDVIVILDTNIQRGGKSSSLRKSMREVGKYFDRLPTIDYNLVDARDRGCLVFKNSDPVGPTIIYLPLVKSDAYSTTFDPDQIISLGGYLRTGNFIYTKEQANQLVGLTEFSMREARELIAQALKDKVMVKRNGKESSRALRV